MARPKGSKNTKAVFVSSNIIETSAPQNIDISQIDSPDSWSVNPEKEAAVKEVIGVLKRDTSLQRQIADEYDLLLIPDDCPTAFVFRNLNGNSVCMNMVNYGSKEAAVNTLRSYGVIV